MDICICWKITILNAILVEKSQLFDIISGDLKEGILDGKTTRYKKEINNDDICREIDADMKRLGLRK